MNSINKTVRGKAIEGDLRTLANSILEYANMPGYCDTQAADFDTLDVIELDFNDSLFGHASFHIDLEQLDEEIADNAPTNAN